MQPAIDGQPANATRPYANLRFRRHDPDVEHRQDLAESIRQSYAAEGGPVIVSPADVQRQLADRGVIVGQKKTRRMLNHLIADGQMVRERRGNSVVYMPTAGEQKAFISNVRPRSSMGKPVAAPGVIPPATPVAAPGVISPATPLAAPLDLSTIKPLRKLTEPELLALHLEPCVEHGYANLQLKNSGAYQCSVYLGPQQYCNRFVRRVASGMAEAPAGLNVNPGTLNLNVDSGDGDAGAGEDLQAVPPDFDQTYLMRHGHADGDTDTPCNYFPRCPNNPGGNPATD